MTDITPDVMTIDEAAVYLRVHSQTIRRRLKDGTLPGARIGRTWRIRRADLDRFLAGTRQLGGLDKA